MTTFLQRILVNPQIQTQSRLYPGGFECVSAMLNYYAAAFEWTISNGTIEEGQGTHQIRVAPASTFTAVDQWPSVDLDSRGRVGQELRATLQFVRLEFLEVFGRLLRDNVLLLQVRV